MMKNQKTYSRIISMIMVLSMLMMCVPGVSVLATDTADSTQQIEFAGGWNPETYPTEGNLYKDRIAVSKTIEPTEKENYFDVTLEIVAKPRVIDQSLDVVVVMDVSNTMNYTHQGLGPADAGYNVKDARLTQTKAAISNFLDLYSADVNLSAQRRFALVTFNSGANTVVPLTTINSEDSAEEIKQLVNDVAASMDNRERFTNMEGGLQLAHNLLKESDASFKHIIFVTDGMPSTYVESGRDSLTQIVGYDTYMTGSYNESMIGEDGYFADALTHKLCTNGVNYSDKAADKTDDVAEAMKSDGINIFSVGIDVDVQSVEDYLYVSQNTSFTTIDRAAEGFVVGDTPESYITWLSENIAGGSMIEKAEDAENIHRFTLGNSSDGLRSAFEDILHDIEIIPAETMEEAYTLDPMSEYVEFVNFYDLDGSAVQRVLNTRNGKDVASFDTETETIKWWLTNTQNFYIDDIGNYVLSVSYRVRLKNEMEGFLYSKAFETNEKTIFYFKTMDFTTGEPLYGDNSIDYPVPEVEGYYGDFSFINQDYITNKPIQGAEFTLEHYGDSCHICTGEALIESRVTSSDEEGRVSFDGLPSGHEYVLKETYAPQDYVAGAFHSVHIAYGKAYFDGTLVDESSPAVVKSNSINPVSIKVNAENSLIGRELKDGEFTFMLEGVGEFGNKFHERAHSNAEGIVEFHNIVFDREGVYNFKVYEIKGDDSTVVYDTTSYEIKFDVTLDSDKNNFLVETKVNGENTDNDRELEFKFANSIRKPVEVEISAEKLFDGQIPSDGIFNFELKDSEGNLLETKTTSQGEIAFDKITYSEAGVYRYTVNESHDCTMDEADIKVFFDHRVYDVIVRVFPEADGDSFSAEVKYFCEDIEVGVALFENETREVAKLKLNGSNTLDGKAPQEERFSFELREINRVLVEKSENDSEGKFDFAELEFNRTGYFVFVISETEGADDEIIYDDTVYTVFVISEAHHNLSNYYLDVTVSIAHGDNFEEISHYYGSDLTVDVNGGIEFNNLTKNKPTEPSSVIEPTEEITDITTEPTEVTDQIEAESEATEVQIATSAQTEVTKPLVVEKEENTSTTSEIPATEEIPLKNQPAAFDTVKTGDGSSMLVWAAVLFVTGGVTAVLIKRKIKDD